eukprot:6139911-Prorocentrum_lima.AAC.1
MQSLKDAVCLKLLLDVIDTNLDYAKLLIFLKAVYMVANEADIAFTERSDDDTDDEDDAGHRSFTA